METSRDICLLPGAELFLENAVVPQTAQESLRRLLSCNAIPERKGAYPIRFRKYPKLDREEYLLPVTPAETGISAADPEGFRNSRKMEELCRKDCHFGYHPEAEGFLSCSSAIRNCGRVSEIDVADLNGFGLGVQASAYYLAFREEQE